MKKLATLALALAALPIGAEAQELDILRVDSLMAIATDRVQSAAIAAAREDSDAIGDGWVELFGYGGLFAEEVLGALATEAGEEEAAGTPLHTAAQWNDDRSVVLALLDGGADAAKRDGNGRRPVDFARNNPRMTGSAAYPRLLVTQPTALVAGRAVTGNLQTSDGVGQYFGYYDEWSYLERAGHNVVITMDSEDVDAYLIVLRDDGTEVARDDDGGNDVNARVQFQVPATGRYTIVAASLFSEETGRYTLRVERSTGDEEADVDCGGTDRRMPIRPASSPVGSSATAPPVRKWWWFPPGPSSRVRPSRKPGGLGWSTTRRARAIEWTTQDTPGVLPVGVSPARRSGSWPCFLGIEGRCHPIPDGSVHAAAIGP